MTKFFGIFSHFFLHICNKYTTFVPDLTETNENMSKQKRFMLDESELPRQWYNIAADMPNKPLPPLNPATKEPLPVE